MKYDTFFFININIAVLFFQLCSAEYYLTHLKLEI